MVFFNNPYRGLIYARGSEIIESSGPDNSEETTAACACASLSGPAWAVRLFEP